MCSSLCLALQLIVFAISQGGVYAPTVTGGNSVHIHHEGRVRHEDYSNSHSNGDGTGSSIRGSNGNGGGGGSGAHGGRGGRWESVSRSDANSDGSGRGLYEIVAEETIDYIENFQFIIPTTQATKDRLLNEDYTIPDGVAAEARALLNNRQDGGRAWFLAEPLAPYLRGSFLSDNQQLRDALDRRNKIAPQVTSQEGKYFVSLADAGMRVADRYYEWGETEDGDDTLRYVNMFLDIATSSMPVVSWGRDLYEAVMGTDAISGEELSAFDRGMAILGAASMGIGSKFGKGLKVINKIVQQNRAISPHKWKKAVHHAEKAVESVRQTAKEWEASIFKMSPPDRVARVKSVAPLKAAENNWKKNNILKKKNGGDRDYYTDSNDVPWGLDTQHGRWEKYNKKTGKHEGEYNFDNIFLVNSIKPERIIKL